MKKIISSLLALALSSTMFAAVASAATKEPTSVKPVITGEITTVKSGRAVIEFSLTSDANYSVNYDTEWSEYSGTEASGFYSPQVELTLSDDVATLFTAINPVAVIGTDAPTYNATTKKIVYASLGNPTSANNFIQNGDVLFKLNCTLASDYSSYTLEQLKAYNLVKSFDKLLISSTVWTISGVKLGTQTYETSYRSDGNGDYSDITGEYVYTAPAKDDVTATKTDGVYTFEYANDYTGSKDLAGKNVVLGSVDTASTDASRINENTTVTVTYDGQSKTYGSTLYEMMKISGQGSIEGTIRFGVVYEGTKDASKFSFTMNNLTPVTE